MMPPVLLPGRRNAMYKAMRANLRSAPWQYPSLGASSKLAWSHRLPPPLLCLGLRAEHEQPIQFNTAICAWKTCGSTNNMHDQECFTIREYPASRPLDRPVAIFTLRLALGIRMTELQLQGIRIVDSTYVSADPCAGVMLPGPDVEAIKIEVRSINGSRLLGG